MPLNEAQLYFNYGDTVSGIEVMLTDPEADMAMLPALTKAGGPMTRAVPWQDINSAWFEAIQVESNVMFLILSLIIMVAALHIVSDLIMLPNDDATDIAILRTMGATRGAVMRIFFIAGASIGVSGTLICFVIGVVFCANIENIRQALSKLTGTPLFDPTVYFLSRMPAEMAPGQVTAVVVMALALTFLATLYPSWRCAMSEVLKLENITRRYKEGEGQLEVFSGLDISVHTGEIVALVGQSGAGKSSLLHIAGLLEAPTSGEIYIEGMPVSGLPDAERTRIRRDRLGFVYQAHHLLPEFDALENVVLPQMIAGHTRADAAKEATRLLTVLGLGQRLTHRPAQLSGGEQQRVAIARALANKPRLLLADEPTGNLDSRTAGGVFEALIAITRAEGLAALIATHNFELASRMDRTLLLDQGRLVEGPKRQHTQN
jgi:lipoprotein-releasing system ATP-binding protein